MRAGLEAEVTVSRTDKTRPWRVKMFESPRNYREVHNHASRPLLDEHGQFVRVAVEGRFHPNGRPVTRIVYVEHPGCDLPEDPHLDSGEYYGCHYTYSWEWINSGEARCPCSMCHQSEWKRGENRQQRYAGRRYVKRDWAYEYEEE